MSTTVAKIIDPTLLFDFEIQLHYSSIQWGGKRKALSDTYLIPHFAGIAGHLPFAKLWAAWSESGLYFDLEVEPTSQMSQPKFLHGSMSGLTLWIDTRHDSGNHRATQYAHQFVFSSKIDEGQAKPLCRMRPVARAFTLPPLVEASGLAFEFQESSEKSSKESSKGYRMEIGIPASALNGYSPGEVQHLGLFYELLFYDHYRQTLSLSHEFRYQEDPSLWCRAALV